MSYFVAGAFGLGVTTGMLVSAADVGWWSMLVVVIVGGLFGAVAGWAVDG